MTSGTGYGAESVGMIGAKVKGIRAIALFVAAENIGAQF